MTPERKLIEAVLIFINDCRPTDMFVNDILTDPSVQSALAAMREKGESYASWQQKRGMLADAVDWAVNEYDEFMKDDAYDSQRVLDRIIERLRGIRDDAATLKPEPVLRWEGDKLWLGEHYTGEVEALPDNDGRWAADVRLGWKSTFHDTREGATAWVETEVRDWLKRAGCV